MFQANTKSTRIKKTKRRRLSIYTVLFCCSLPFDTVFLCDVGIRKMFRFVLQCIHKQGNTEKKEYNTDIKQVNILKKKVFVTLNGIKTPIYIEN